MSSFLCALPRFIAIGSTNAVVGTTVFLGFYLLGVPDVLCNLSAVLAGVSSSLFLHHRFSDKSWTIGFFTFRFGLASTISYLCNLGIFAVLSNTSIFHPGITNILSTLVYSVCFYLMMNSTFRVDSRSQENTNELRQSIENHRPATEGQENSQRRALPPSREKQVLSGRKRGRFRRNGGP